MPKQTASADECRIAVNNLTVHFLLGRKRNHLQNTDLQERLIRYNLHTHAHGEIFICYHKSIQINLEHTSATLTEGDILYIPPNVPHVCITPNTEQNFTGFGVLFSSKSASSDFGRHLSPIIESTQPQILHAPPEHLNAWRSRIYDSVSEPDLTALEMLTLLTRTVKLGFSALPLPPTAEEQEAPGNITRTAELEYIIDSRFMTHLTRSDVAAKLFISTRQLDRICQKRFGKSFHDRITERRLSAAVQMLTETDQTVDEISQQVGFPSKSGLYHDFSKKFGITPYQFRKKHRDPSAKHEA